MKNKIKFVSNNDGGWLGNGLGTVPNSYKVVVNGVERGEIFCLSSGEGWRWDPKDRVEKPGKWVTRPSFVAMKETIRSWWTDQI